MANTSRHHATYFDQAITLFNAGFKPDPCGVISTEQRQYSDYADRMSQKVEGLRKHRGDLSSEFGRMYGKDREQEAKEDGEEDRSLEDEEEDKEEYQSLEYKLDQHDRQVSKIIKAIKRHPHDILSRISEFQISNNPKKRTKALKALQKARERVQIIVGRKKI